ncbi:MAG: flagellar basal body P-ring formation protein FlgA [Bradyrhizobiaceae bacterium]|nr:flagellar basal body P-ring formation protein FlgA [Bradyrhizobiaceae bacterium]
MTRHLPALTLAALLVILNGAAEAANVAAPVPAMKAETTVTADVVKLGDLIDNAGPAAAIPVFHAPELGTSGTIQTHRVIAAARDNGLSHFDTRGLNEVMITRAARAISLAELEQAVAEAAVRDLGLGGIDDVSIRLDRNVRALHVEPNAVDAPRIVQFYYDPHTQRFDGFVEVPGSAALRKNPVRVSGTLVETAEFVVIARPLARGEPVRDSDILLERKPRAEIPSDAVTRVGAVIGQAARRALRAGQTLRPADLMKPDLVGRNEMVTILFAAPGLSLTARGKALAAGAEGDTVTVLNPQSKRVLQATVTGPGLVTAGRGAALTADASGSIR